MPPPASSPHNLKAQNRIRASQGSGPGTATGSAAKLTQSRQMGKRRKGRVSRGHNA